MAIEGSTDCDRKEDHNKTDQKTLKTPIEHLEPSQSVDRLGIHLLFYNKLTYNLFFIYKAVPSSSASTSDNDPCIADVSLESADIKNWIRSESYTSVPSWASSISLDSQSEELALEFMRSFVGVLFTDSGSMTMEMKSDFGQYARVSKII